MNRQLLYLLLAGGVFLSCSSNNDDLEDNRLEPAVSTDSIMVITPRVLKASLKSYYNPEILIDDVDAELIGDSIIEFWVPYLMHSKELIPYIEYEGESLMWEDKIIDENQKIDFKVPTRLTVINKKGDKKDYKVYVFSFTGLPVVWIETEGRTSITSKEEYLKASFRLEENVITRSAGVILEDSVQIKGRGTTSWTVAPKKSYRLKFDRKVSLLNEPKDKSWVLIANFFDRAMIRNKIGYYLGEISDLEYTPKFHFVELMLNGIYDGTYMLGEHLKISEDRVNVGKDGFLVEIDAEVKYEGGFFFNTDSIPNPISIKDPDVSEGDENYEYIKNYFQEAEKILYSEFFQDPEEGWQKYLDMTSFVDWWIIHEITRNADACAFGKSCYMNLKRGNKLRMGPIWDFDLAFGNNPNPGVYSIEGFTYIHFKNKWFKRLFEDPAFVKKVKERYTYFYKQRDLICREINSTVDYLHYSIIENENRWHSLYDSKYYHRDVWGSYNNEVQYMKGWLIQRMDWLNTAIDKLN